MRLLAVSGELASDTLDHKAPIVDYLARTFVRRGGSHPYGSIDPVVVGSAIERGGRIVDALQYYEHLEADRSQPADVRAFAALRRVRSLERHAEYLDARRDVSQAKSQHDRAVAERRRLRIGKRALLEFPVVGEQPPPAPVVVEPTAFQARVDQATARVNILNLRALEAVTVDVETLELTGNTVIDLVEAKAPAVAAWGLPGWDMVLRVERQRSRARVVGTVGRTRVVDAQLTMQDDSSGSSTDRSSRSRP